MPRPLLCFFALGLTAAPAVAQPAASLERITSWERLGDAPQRIYGLAFAPQAGDPTGDPVVWASESDLWRLDPSPGGGPGMWTEVAHLEGGRYLLLLPEGGATPDTLLLIRQSIVRSLDGGATFATVLGASGDDLAEAPVGSPHAGALYAAISGGAAVSTDRGATWTEADPFPQMLSVYRVLPLASGRVVVAGISGVALSDDGGLSYSPSPGLYEYLRYGIRAADVLAGAGDGGADRLVAAVAQNGVAGETVRVSDDGGATWRVTWAIPGGGGIAEEVVPLPGPVGALVRSALLVLSRGPVYRTDDAGETWGLVGEVPCVAEDTAGATTARVAALGPDGRLYVGCQRQGTQEPWSYRTGDPVIVASEGAPEAAGGLALAAVPSPSSGSVALALTVPRLSFARVAVYDMLGREVAVVHNGPLGAGTHRLSFDAAALAPGVYVAHAVMESGAVTARLVRTR